MGLSLILIAVLCDGGHRQPGVGFGGAELAGAGQAEEPFDRAGALLDAEAALRDQAIETLLRRPERAALRMIPSRWRPFRISRLALLAQALSASTRWAFAPSSMVPNSGLSARLAACSVPASAGADQS